MKRALVVLIAVLAVMLVYPASTPSAKAPRYTDTPTIQVHPQGPAPMGPGLTGEEDEGDGDDLAGMKDGTRADGGGVGLSTFGPQGSLAKVWWMYFLSNIRIMF